MLNKTILEQVRNDELSYENTLSAIADRICRDKDIKMILITGGSCAGKTTTTRKLSELITANGRFAHTVSLDDYYRNLDESVYLPDGTRDIESLNSLRVDMIHRDLDSLLSGKATPLPMYDFKLKARIEAYRTVTLNENDVVIVEGLHALSPHLFATPPAESTVYRVYLYADAGDGTDCRFVRRMVRDSRHRNASAEHTFTLWDNVKKNEYVSIEPYRKYADVTINTFFPYERGILSDDAVANLSTVSQDSAYHDTAAKLIETLSPIPQISDDYIPENSLLREFI